MLFNLIITLTEKDRKVKLTLNKPFKIDFRVVGSGEQNKTLRCANIKDNDLGGLFAAAYSMFR